MGNITSLKEYYIKIHELYNNAVNMLTAINQSFHSKASEITIKFVDTNNVSQNVRIPSFLWLENKIEQLDNNLSNLINIPKSGEAWFSNTNNMHKLQFVKSTTAPLVPTFDDSNISAHVKQNNIFKDLVSPKTYLKLDLTNVPDNIDNIFMKKIVIHDSSLYEAIYEANLNSYDEYKAFLVNTDKGKDYDEYDSTIKMPIKRDEYKSEFKIIDIPTNSGEQNPYSNENGNNIYKIVVDTATYYDEDDSATSFILHKGQYLTLSDDYVIYKVLSVNSTKVENVVNHELILEEILGHVNLQTFEENSAMTLSLYNINYDKYHYVELPVEENQYIVIFLSTIYNNIRSSLSKPLLLNMGSMTMVDENNKPILYNGKEISYIDYYNKYCKNIGDLIDGISMISYPQLSNFTFNDLKELQDGEAIQSFISTTISNDNLRVQRINTHLIDDEYSSQLINLHAKKIELSAQIDSLQQNINDTYNTLVNNSENYSIIEKDNIKQKLDSYYTERIKLQREVISIIDNINILKTNVYGTASAKYRIRGNAMTTNLDNYISEHFLNCIIIGMQYEYKYKSITTDTTMVSNINSSIFTEWNRVTNDYKERKLVFNNVSNTYDIVNVQYNSTQNVVKWNQIDIPITQGEDVVIRVRYIYSIGQPFMNLYSPWSDELTVKFPLEYNDSLELASIIEKNDDDTTYAAFNKTLIDDGYQEHISNKVIDNSQTFYHMPENIYSGFNTPENKYLSLKEKLQMLTNDIDQYKQLFEFDTLSTFDIYIEYEGNTIKLNKNSTNYININETDNLSISNITYITKNMNLVIKNNGNVPLKLYSILPGQTNKMLYQVNNDTQNKLLNDYESVPLLKNSVNIGDISESLYRQRLGQWIYFRKNNPYTQKNYYLVSDTNVVTDPTYDGKMIFNSDIQFGLPSNKLNDSAYDILINIMNKYNKSQFNYSIPTSDLLLELENAKANALTNKYDHDYQFRYYRSSNDIAKVEKIRDKISKDQELTSNEKTQFDKINQISPMILKYENMYVAVNNKIVNINKDIFSEFNNDDDIILYNYGKTYKLKDLSGAFFIPQLNEENQLLCDNDQYYRQINVGDYISIPILFEYYMNDTGSISKYLNFDIKTSLAKDIYHYELCATVTYNQSYNNSNDESIESQF